MVKLLLVIFGICLVRVSADKSVQSSEAGGISGTQVLRVFLKDDADIINLDSIRNQISFEVIRRSRSEVDFIVSSSKLAQTKKLLASSSLTFKVLIHDVLKKIVAQNDTASYQKPRLMLGKESKFPLDQYHSLEDINKYLDYLSTIYKNFVSTKVIGTTLAGRPFKLLIVESEKQGAPCVWIDGGIHAREWVSPAAVLYITNQLVEHRDKLPPKMRDLTYYILPVINPDGYEYSRKSADTRLWRKNRKPPGNGECFGVDLNRNFPYKWGGLGTSTYSCSEVYKGPHPASEVETNIIIGYLSSRAKRFKGFLTFHSYSQYILIPYGYDVNAATSDYDELKRVADIAVNNIKNVTGAVYKAGNTGEVFYPAAGGSDDWAKSIGIKYVYTVELRDTGDHAFLLPASEIIPTSKDAFEVVKAVANAI